MPGENPTLDGEMLQAIKDNIGKALTDLRDLSRSMNSEYIRMRPIHETLQSEIERINRTGILHAMVTSAGQQKEMEPSKKLILFRIVQESIQNCLKHAEAEKLTIHIDYQDTTVSVLVENNGKGFDMSNAVKPGWGQGLINMQTRVRLTGGSCKIDSAMQKGTKIFFRIPYE